MYAPRPTFGVLHSANRQASHKYMALTSRHFGHVKIHRAVCEAFHGRPPEGAVVLHLDEDGLNNRADNLAWGTQKENMNMPKLKAYHRSRTGENSARAIWAANRGAF